MQMLVRITVPLFCHQGRKIFYLPYFSATVIYCGPRTALENTTRPPRDPTQHQFSQRPVQAHPRDPSHGLQLPTLFFLPLQLLGLSLWILSLLSFKDLITLTSSSGSSLNSALQPVLHWLRYHLQTCFLYQLPALKPLTSKDPLSLHRRRKIQIRTG